MVKGLVQISVFSLVILTVSILLKETFQVEHVHVLIYWLILFFWIQHVLLHLGVQFLRENIDIDYSMLLLASVSARLIISLFSFLIIAMTMVEDMTRFAINFSIVYLLFLVFEISSVLSNLRRNSSQVQIDD